MFLISFAFSSLFLTFCLIFLFLHVMLEFTACSCSFHLDDEAEFISIYNSTACPLQSRTVILMRFIKSSKSPVKCVPEDLFMWW